MRVNIQKRGDVYQYRIEIGRVNGPRKYLNKSGFRTRKEAELAGQIVMNDYLNGGINSNSNMSYADYLDFWIKEYCEVEYKYTTTKRYKESLGAIKNELGTYKLRLITPYMINQALLRMSQKVKTKTALRNYQKVIKSSFKAATNYFGLLEYNPAATTSISRMQSSTLKKTE